VKDATIEEEYAVRVSQAMAIADDAQRAKKLALAEAIRAQAYATNASADAAAKEKHAQEQAQREAEQRARQIQRATASAIEQALTDVSNGVNPARAFFAMLKQATIHAISEALAEKFLASKFAQMLGIGVEGAAKTQNIAADKMVDSSHRILHAAEIMAGIVPSEPGTGTPGTSGDKPDTKAPAWLGTLKKIGEYAAVAYGGYQAGQATGQAVYSQNRGTVANYVIGAVGGAVSGASTGAALGSVFGPVGTVAGAAIGAVAGFIGGIVGVHKASKEAAEATKQLRDALEQNMQTLRNRVNHDDLGEAIHQVNEERKKAAQQIEDAYAYGDRNSANVRERTRLLAEMNALEDKYIAQLKEEAAAKSRYFTEDLDVRALRAQGLDKQADALDFQHQQQRELDEYRRTHDMTQPANQDQYARLQQVQAMEAQKRATDANTAAVNALTTTLTNAPSGFKIEPYIQQYAKAMPYPGQWEAPTSPLRPPLSPLNPPTLSRADSVGSTGTATPARYSFTLPGAVFQINGNRSGEEMLGEIAAALDDVKERTLGGTNTATRADALQRVTARRSTTVSIS
jgi:hypothetical protein